MFTSDCLPTACFSVHAPADPGVMPRVLQQFAKRGLTPSRWHSSVGGRGGGDLAIDVEMVGLDAEAAERLAASLRQIAHVELVVTCEKHPELGT